MSVIGFAAMSVQAGFLTFFYGTLTVGDAFSGVAVILAAAVGMRSCPPAAGHIAWMLRRMR